MKRLTWIGEDDSNRRKPRSRAKHAARHRQRERGHGLPRETHGALRSSLPLVQTLVSVLLFLAAGVMARAEVVTEFVNATNAASTNYFLGKTGIGTNTPAQPLHVVGNSQLDGGLTVGGAFQVPKQGDVSMGVVATT